MEVKFRFNIDYRKLNEAITSDVHPLPNIYETLGLLEESKYFSVTNMQTGFQKM